VSTAHGGRLTDEDRAEIERLAGEGWSCGRIAQKLKRHPSTVQWYMYSAGLKAPKPAPANPLSYMRNGRRVRHFSADEDVFIEALRVQDFSFEKIAELVNKRFGTERTHHTIQCRLIMLSARESTA
jgi:IS30 family transposase